MPILDSQESLIKYACESWSQGTVNEFESAYVGYLDRNRRLIKWQLFNTGDSNSCDIDVQKMMRTAVALDAKGLILAHNHPTGKTDPSPADIKTTEYIYRGCQFLGIELIDHVIVSSGEGPHSFNRSGYIQKFKNNTKQYNEMFESGTFANVAFRIVDDYCSAIAKGRRSEASAMQTAKWQLEKVYIKFFDPIV